jgi:hypothetical protein
MSEINRNRTSETSEPIPNTSALCCADNRCDVSACPRISTVHGPLIQSVRLLTIASLPTARPTRKSSTFACPGLW